MRVFVINLDKDADRMAAVAARLDALDISYERFPAVYAKTMTAREKRRRCNRFRWRCANGRKMLDGELGCALSHLGLYRKMLAEGIDKMCILEDDVVIDERFPIVLAKLEKVYDAAKPHVVLLSNHMEPPAGQVGEAFVGYLTEQARNEFHVEICGWDCFSEAYVIGAAAAKAILKQNDPVIAPADAWCRWQDNGAIRLFRAFPTVCCQNKHGFVSNMLSEAFQVRNLSFLHQLTYRILRAVGLCIDTWLRKRLGC